MTLRLKIILTLFLGVTLLVGSYSIFSLVRFISKRVSQQSQQESRSIPTAPGQQGARTDFFTPSALQEQATPRPGPALVQPTAPAAVQPPPQPTGEPGAKERPALVALALPFVERFGSYSNQSNFENFSDLLSFMAPEMRVWARRQIENASQAGPAAIYKGVSTKAVSYTIIEIDEKGGTADMRVSTQRKELIGTSSNYRVFNQDILVRLVRSDSVWLVESARWQ